MKVYREACWRSVSTFHISVSAAALIAVASLSYAVLPGQGLYAQQRRAKPAQRVQRSRSALPGDRVPPLLGPARDSTQAVAIARRVLYEPNAGISLRVALFVATDDGFLIRLLTDPAVPGGGGLLWVEADGSVLVLRRYR
jgi:hypothetical protein